MNELKKELNEINRQIAVIVLATIKTKGDISQEKKLWIRKREILAKLNPINL